jgi:hypothetical protein
MRRQFASPTSGGDERSGLGSLTNILGSED